MTIDNKAKLAKLRAVKNAFKQLEKSTKKEGIVCILGDTEERKIEVIPTGSIMFDLALGCGGFPKGRIIELYGAESSGKTLSATKAMAQCQQQGGLAALIDMEHAFDPAFARKLGLNTEELILSQPDHLQDAFTVIDALIDAGVDIIVLDSIASLVPREELEGEVGKQTVGLVARYMSQFLRRVTGKVSKNNVTFICINQVRDAVGVMYGDPTTTPGGKALKFYASVRCQISKVGGSNVTKKIGGEDVVVGHTVRASVKKNKCGAPFKKAEYQIFYDGRKVDAADEIAQVALLKGLIPKYDAAGNISPTGRTYKIAVEDEELIAKKKDDVAVELKKYPKIQEKLLKMLKEGIDAEDVHNQIDTDADLTDEEFEAQMRADIAAIENGYEDDAEEVEEISWMDM